jgi:hypothetical protein
MYTVNVPRCLLITSNCNLANQECLQGFYNPVTDRLTEPELTGISYSFTNDGWYEEAYYRAIPNREWFLSPHKSSPFAQCSTATQPACPQAIMQWQHGTYSLPGNGSILLQPIAVDGRQLVSSPCSYDQSVYTRYEQPELFQVRSIHWILYMQDHSG